MQEHVVTIGGQKIVLYVVDEYANPLLTQVKKPCTPRMSSCTY